MPARPKPTKKPSAAVKFKGSLTYTATAAARRPDIIQAVERALRTYNIHADFSGNIHVDYDPNVPTAHTAGFNGTITFGGMISYRTALHEIAHWVGVGTHGKWWDPGCRDTEKNVWVGPKACAKIKEFQGADAVVHADQLHFWDFGLNYESELTNDADRKHVLIVKALVDDMN